MKKNIIKCLSFACLALLAIGVCYRVLAWKDTSGAYVSVTEQLYNTDKNLIDVAFVGSSHVYTSIYPAYLWEEYGISAFDMSLSEQDKYCSYYCLKELLKTQRPRVVCLEMYGLMFEDHRAIGDEYRNMLAIKPSLNAYELAKNGYATQDEMDYLLRWPIVHTRYKELDKYDFENNEINKYSRGAVMGWGLRQAGYMNPEIIEIQEAEPLSNENKSWLDSFIDLSDEYGFDLVFFLAPDFQSVEQKKISNGAREYAQENGIDYLDFTELAAMIGFDPETDMGDLIHCNANGAYKVTSYFGNYLKENYIIEDHRGDKKYHQWDEDYKLLEQIVQENNLYEAAEDDFYLDFLSTSTDLTVLLSLDGEFEGCIGLMEKFGISYEECLDGGKWIYKNGQATKIMSNNPGEAHIYDINKFDSLKIQCVPEGADARSNILFGLEQQVSVLDGLNVWVYDDVMQKAISKRGFIY